MALSCRPTCTAGDMGFHYFSTLPILSRQLHLEGSHIGQVLYSVCMGTSSGYQTNHQHASPPLVQRPHSTSILHSHAWVGCAPWIDCTQQESSRTTHAFFVVFMWRHMNTYFLIAASLIQFVDQSTPEPNCNGHTPPGRIFSNGHLHTTGSKMTSRT